MAIEMMAIRSVSSRGGGPHVIDLPDGQINLIYFSALASCPR
jgi:hypothetical protein